MKIKKIPMISVMKIVPVIVKGTVHREGLKINEYTRTLVSAPQFVEVYADCLKTFKALLAIMTCKYIGTYIYNLIPEFSLVNDIVV